MSEEKHTPGPWHVVTPIRPGPQEENDRLIATEDKKHVAEVFQYQNNENQNGPSLANARLIASAPKMLELLRLAVKARDAGEQLFDDWYDEVRTMT